MAVNGTDEPEKKPLEADDQTPPPASYAVAREAPDTDNLNTIDIFGEGAFPV